jgi:1-phosphofructokinase
MESNTHHNKVVTITLNPSLDQTLITSHLHIGYHNHVAGTTHLDASGRGVNISRALDRLGIPTLAVVLLGDGAISQAFRGLMMEENFPSRIVRHEGPTRSDTIIVDTGEETETHIIDEGASCSADDVQNILHAITDVVEAGDTVILAGTLPRDAAPDIYRKMTEAAHNLNAKVVVLADGEALKQVLSAQPEMVTLTRLEAESLFNYPVRNFADMISGGNKLREQGAGQVLIVAENFSGAVLVDEPDNWVVTIADLENKGTDSGVVDAMLAGYLSGAMRNLSPQEALVLGAASLSYAASQIGNEFGSLSDIKQLRSYADVQTAEAFGDLSLTGQGD